MPLISIVVPVYNVEDYVALSLESARSQTLSDIEIVCVDDGSTDSSGAILDLAAKADSRIVVVHKENGGLSSARNAGIRHASGRYVCFLDSDDLLVESACETLVREFESTGASVITYGAFAYPECNSYPWLDAVLSPRRVEYRPFDIRLLFGESSSPFAWRTACKRDFLLNGGVLFDETLLYGEDQAFQFGIYPRSPHTLLIPDKLVRYRVSRSGSFMNTRLNDPVRMARDHVTIADHILRDWKSIGFLDKYSSEALDWVAEFSLIRILQLDEGFRGEILELARAVLLESFEKDLLERYRKEGLASSLVSAVMLSGRSLTNGDRRRAVYDYLAKRNGRKFVVKMLASRLAHSGPWGRLLSSVEQRACDRDEALKGELLAQWEKDDELLRREASLSVGKPI